MSFASVLISCQSTPAEESEPVALIVTTQPATATAEPSATATQTATATATATTDPTPIPSATPTAEPSATPTATATATATPRPTRTPTPTVTPTLVAIYGAREMVDAQRSRFTGELIEDEEIRNRRPIICKISNWEHQWVRPQSGLNSADLIFEHVTEGPITRFSALFHSKTPPNIGPIRSARLIDLELPQMYDAALCFSGASIGVQDRLDDSVFSDRLIRSSWKGYYRSGEEKPLEHTFYADPEPFWERLTELGLNSRPRTWGQMAFVEEKPTREDCEFNPTCDDGAYVWISYRKYTIVEWHYDAELGKYARWAEGEPVIDKNDEQQVTASNVILLFAKHTLDESICEHQQDNKCYAGSTHMDLDGDGYATILRDGQRYDGTWQRSRANEMLTFYGWNGEVIPLQLGNSWIQVIPAHYKNVVGWDEDTRP
ncbi:MAG: DUF3048 domain-containing protein [Candidatus Promineifilaceae bacterium]